MMMVVQTTRLWHTFRLPGCQHGSCTTIQIPSQEPDSRCSNSATHLPGVPLASQDSAATTACSPAQMPAVCCQPAPAARRRAAGLPSSRRGSAAAGSAAAWPAAAHAPAALLHPALFRHLPSVRTQFRSAASDRQPDRWPLSVRRPGRFGADRTPEMQGLQSAQAALKATPPVCVQASLLRGLAKPALAPWQGIAFFGMARHACRQAHEMALLT